MREIGVKTRCSVATVALAHVLAKPFVMSVIIGANRLDQLDRNLAATSLELNAEDMARLDRISVLTPEYPGWMVERQTAGPLAQAVRAKGLELFNAITARHRSCATHSAR